MEGRLTITSMGVDLGAKNAIMESDENTRKYMAKFGREADWIPVLGDEDADYPHFCFCQFHCQPPSKWV